VSGNTGLNGKDGVSFVNSHFITIQGHELVGSNTGIDMKFGAADNIILDNTLTDVKLFGLSLSDNNKVLDNTITGSGRFGILIFGGSKNVIEGNTVLDNGYSRQEPIFAGIAVGAGSWRALGVNDKTDE
jgi:parallel beta-helix repeat protein